MKLSANLRARTMWTAGPAVTRLLPLGRFGDEMTALLRNAASMVGSFAVTGGLGFPYWWLAARTFPPEAVGFAAATTSAMMLLGNFGMLGMGTLLAGVLPRTTGDRGTLIGTALLTAASAGLGLGLVFAVVFPSPLGLHALSGSIALIVVFAAGVGLTSMTTVADQILLSLRRGGLQLRRNVIFAGTKLAALAALGVASLTAAGSGICATWVLGLAISTVWLATVVVRGGGRLYASRPRWRTLWAWRRHAVEHHLLNLALFGSSRVLPIITAAVVSVAASGYLYTATLITGFLGYGAFALSFALYSVRGRDTVQLGPLLRCTLRFAFGVILVANLILLVGADLILQAFGPQYAAHAAMALRIMGVSTFFVTIIDHYVAVARIRGTLRRAAVLAAGGAVLEVACAAGGGALAGITGVALGSGLACAVEAAIMSPTLLRELRADRAPAAGVAS